MKKTWHLFALLFLSLFISCEEWEGIPMDFSDPQEIMPVLNVLPEELVTAFGEEHIHFGALPPDLSDISFKVEGMDYVTSIRYLFGPTDDDPYILSPTTPPSYDATLYFHHFMDQKESLAQHRLKTIDASQNIFIRDNDTVYVIGQNNQFTAYYTETIDDDDAGIPTNYMIVSGTLVRDENTQAVLGIKDYRIGKMIKSYEHHPRVPSYAPGTLEVKTHIGLSPYYVWDTLTDTSRY